MLVDVIATTRFGPDFRIGSIAFAKAVASVAQNTTSTLGRSTDSDFVRSATVQLMPSDCLGDRETPRTASPLRARCAAMKPPTIPVAPNTTFFIFRTPRRWFEA